MSKARRNFDADFKLNICKFIREQGLTIAQIAVIMILVKLPYIVG